MRYNRDRQPIENMNLRELPATVDCLSIAYGTRHTSEIQIVKNQYVRNARFACCILSHLPSRWPNTAHFARITDLQVDDWLMS